MEKSEITELMEGITEALELSEPLRPLINDAIDVLLSYGPETKKLLDQLRKGICQLRIDSIDQYERSGFTREEAIQISLGDSNQLTKINNSIKSRGGKK
jgi:hypothetical protein